MAEAAFRERRKYRRIPTDQMISFAEAGCAERFGYARDVSRGGIRFEVTACEVPFGAFLRVAFHFEDRRVEATGRVVWVTEIDAISVDVGIAFVETDLALAEALRGLEAETACASLQAGSGPVRPLGG
jgi:hypothetical protein